MRALASLTVVLALGACTGISPQLHPTDIEALEQLEDRKEREQAYRDNSIYRERSLKGTRYTKGDRPGARKRSWQSLEAVLRSDRNSAAALPTKPIRAARVLTALLATSAIVTIGGFAATAREGLDLSRMTGPGWVLLGGGIASVGFGIGAGVAWGRARKGYDSAVDVYNDSLGLRLGLYDAEGEFRPPEGVLVDEEGFIILDQKELGIPGIAPEPEPQRIDPAPIEPMPFDGPSREAPADSSGTEPAPDGLASTVLAPTLVGPSRPLPRVEGPSPRPAGP